MGRKQGTEGERERGGGGTRRAKGTVPAKSTGRGEEVSKGGRKRIRIRQGGERKGRRGERLRNPA